MTLPIVLLPFLKLLYLGYLNYFQALIVDFYQVIILMILSDVSFERLI